MAQYDIIELPKMHGSDETILYPKLKHIRMIEDEEFIHRMANEPGGTTAAMTQNVYAATANMLARLLSEGYSVRLKGIGTFMASIGMKKGKVYEQTDDKRNARSIEVKKINFVADKHLVKETDRRCYLERNDVKHINHVATTEDERLAMALRFLDTHPFLTVADYKSLTGLTLTKAKNELKKFRETEGSGLTYKGRGNHLVYLKE